MATIKFSISKRIKCFGFYAGSFDKLGLIFIHNYLQRVKKADWYDFISILSGSFIWCT